MSTTVKEAVAMVGAYRKRHPKAGCVRCTRDVGAEPERRAKLVGKYWVAPSEPARSRIGPVGSFEWSVIHPTCGMAAGHNLSREAAEWLAIALPSPAKVLRAGKDAEGSIESELLSEVQAVAEAARARSEEERGKVERVERIAQLRAELAKLEADEGAA